MRSFIRLVFLALLPIVHGQVCNADEQNFRHEFIDHVKAIENAGKIGRNDEGLWSPHASVEGGTPTLGYGHKLTATEVAAGEIDINGVPVPIAGGFTDAQIDALLQQDLTNAYNQAVRTFGQLSWDSMQPAAHELATEYTFNLGPTAFTQPKWPKFFEALRTSNKTLALEEFERSAVINGQVQPLTGRNAATQIWIQQNFESAAQLRATPPLFLVGGLGRLGPSSLNVVTVNKPGDNKIGYILPAPHPTQQDFVIGEPTACLFKPGTTNAKFHSLAHTPTAQLTGWCLDASKKLPLGNFGIPWTSDDPDHWAYWVRKATIMAWEKRTSFTDPVTTIQSALWYITDRAPGGQQNPIIQAINYTETSPSKNVQIPRPNTGGVTVWFPTKGNGA